MSIFMIGIDHNMAPVDVRAQFAFTRKNTGEALRRLAGCWLYQRIQMLDQRGFSASCVSDDPDKLAVRDHKADILQRMALIGCPGAVGIGYIF